MPKYSAVSREFHADQTWQHPRNYSFAAKEPLAPLVLAEVGQAAVAMPVAFVENAGQYQLVGVLSYAPGQNMFVTRAGQWLGNYVPVCFRVYPFRFIKPEAGKDAILCIDDESGLVTPASYGGEAFFDADGNPGTTLKGIIELLQHAESSRQVTGAAIEALAAAGLISEWPITVSGPEGPKKLGGLFRIDEAALNRLSDEAFVAFRKNQALPLAYAQLMSMTQVRQFTELQKQQQASPPAAALGGLDTIDKLLELPGGDTIRFK